MLGYLNTCLNVPEMVKQFELFGQQKRNKEKKRKPQFEAVIDGFGVGTIEETKKKHECFVCQLSIKAGSKAEKHTPIVDDRPQWQYAKYRHLPACPLPENESV